MWLHAMIASFSPSVEMTTKDSLQFHVVRSTFPMLFTWLCYALKPDTRRLHLAVSWPLFYFQLKPVKKQLFSLASQLWAHPLLPERAPDIQIINVTEFFK